QAWRFASWHHRYIARWSQWPYPHPQHMEYRHLDELRPLANDIEIYKTRYSEFYNTELDSILRERDIQYLIVTGCTTSVCVESTIRDAMFRDYSCILLEDCTAEPIGQGLPRGNHDASVLTIQTLFGWVSKSTDVLKCLATTDVSMPAE